MIDIVPGITFSDAEKQVYGSIAAALMGALIGTIASFAIANRERRKQDELQKLNTNKLAVRESAKALSVARQTLADIIVKSAANVEYATDISQGFSKSKDNGKMALMQLSSPFLYPSPDVQLTQIILNDEIITYWSNLHTEIELQNKSIRDFDSFYQSLFTTLHTMLLKDENISTKVITSDESTALVAMDQQLIANSLLRNKCINIIAHIDCFARYINEGVDARSIQNLKKYREYIDRLKSFVPDADDLKKSKIEIDANYDPSEMFMSTRLSSRDETPKV